jgi:tetratricopeptide (TPR) repeat protein
LTVCAVLAASVSFAPLAHGQTQAAGDPDVLYAQREDPAKARQAVDAWTQRVKANPKDFESEWKLAKALYWLGGHGPEANRRADLEAGMAAADAAIALDPKRPEGYFWKAANMGALAESFGMRQGIKYRKPIREALETVLKIDPKFQAGSADRALGRWYYKVPGLFGGSNEKSVEHLRKSIEYDPNSTASYFFLAETLLDMGRKADARAALQKVLDAPIDADWAPEDREFKQKARDLLKTIGS